jgi:hypothetical protein
MASWWHLRRPLHGFTRIVESSCMGRNVSHCWCVLLLFVVAAALNLEHTHPKVSKSELGGTICCAAVAWTTHMATHSALHVSYHLIKGFAMPQKMTRLAPPAAFHMSRINNIHANMASRPLEGVASHFHLLEKAPQFNVPPNISHHFWFSLPPTIATALEQCPAAFWPLVQRDLRTAWEAIRTATVDGRAQQTAWANWTRCATYCWIDPWMHFIPIALKQTYFIAFARLCDSAAESFMKNGANSKQRTNSGREYVGSGTSEVGETSKH